MPDFELCVDSIRAAEIGVAAGVNSLEVCSVRGFPPSAPRVLRGSNSQAQRRQRRLRLAVSRRRLGLCALCWTSSLAGIRKVPSLEQSAHRARRVHMQVQRAFACSYAAAAVTFTTRLMKLAS